MPEGTREQKIKQQRKREGGSVVSTKTLKVEINFYSSVQRVFTLVYINNKIKTCACTVIWSRGGDEERRGDEGIREMRAVKGTSGHCLKLNARFVLKLLPIGTLGVDISCNHISFK